MKKYKTVLVVPDLHCPVHHPDAFKFIDALNEKYKPDLCINLGDEINAMHLSFHDKDPDCAFSPSSELEAAIWHLKDLYVICPNMKVIESNHGSLLYRRAKKFGIPRHLLKSYREVLEAPKGWSWHIDLKITCTDRSEVYFHHGLSNNALKIAKEMGMHHACGHYHNNFGVQYYNTPNGIRWGANVGCLIDDKNLAFNYNKNNLGRPMLGAMIIISGIPIMQPMILDKNHRWTGKLLDV